jgi:hypothetical protein
VKRVKEALGFKAIGRKVHEGFHNDQQGSGWQDKKMIFIP